MTSDAEANWETVLPAISVILNESVPVPENDNFAKFRPLPVIVSVNVLLEREVVEPQERFPLMDRVGGVLMQDPVPATPRICVPEQMVEAAGALLLKAV
jgi:hypothetical protein